MLAGWRIGYQQWRRFEAGLYPSRITVTWEDRGRPWFVLDVDGVMVNVPVPEQLTNATAAAEQA
jgi:nucleoid-associated protein YgaU